MDDETKVTIGFKYINAYQDRFEAESEVSILEDVGYGEHRTWRVF